MANHDQSELPRIKRSYRDLKEAYDRSEGQTTVSVMRDSLLDAITALGELESQIYWMNDRR